MVGVDGSDSAMRAVGWAAREAAARRVALRIVFASPYSISAAQAWRLPARRARGIVGRARQHARSLEPTLPVRSAVLHGPPARVLLEQAQQAELVVLGARGIDGFKGLALGSVPTAVATHAHCPVVVVRRPPAVEREPDSPVVVGVDGSRSSMLALRFGFEFAARHHRPLTAVHSWYELAEYTMRDVAGSGFESRAVADAQRRLAEWLEECTEQFPGVVVHSSVERDRPTSALMRYSTRAELLVVGSRGRGGFRGLLLGSTSQELMRYASGPVAIVHDAVATDDSGEHPLTADVPAQR